MNRLLRIGLLTALGLAALYAGYRILAHTRADAALAAGDADAALQALPGHPDALQARAERQLRDGDPDAAAATARQLIAAAPLDGRPWRILAQIEAAAGRSDQAHAWFTRAVALSPREAGARAWLADELLAQGHYGPALDHIESILATAPRQRAALLGVLVQLSVDPDFVAALVPRLASHPDWRPAYLRELQRGAEPATTAAVMAALAADGGLDPAEDARWIDDLIGRGLWGQAYAHWASTLPPGATLATVFNNDFEQPPGGSGFDWRTPAIPGQTVTFEAAGENGGQAALLEFRSRAAPRAGLEQALLLAPGRHRLQVRQRPDNLRSDTGLEWVLVCNDGRVLGRSPRFGGSSGWTTLEAELEVPDDCPGQWLRLHNPAPTARTQVTEGRLWIDRVRIVPVRP